MIKNVLFKLSLIISIIASFNVLAELDADDQECSIADNYFKIDTSKDYDDQMNQCKTKLKMRTISQQDFNVKLVERSTENDCGQDYNSDFSLVSENLQRNSCKKIINCVKTQDEIVKNENKQLYCSEKSLEEVMDQSLIEDVASDFYKEKYKKDSLDNNLEKLKLKINRHLGKKAEQVISCKNSNINLKKVCTSEFEISSDLLDSIDLSVKLQNGTKATLNTDEAIDEREIHLLRAINGNNLPPSTLPSEIFRLDARLKSDSIKSIIDEYNNFSKMSENLGVTNNNSLLGPGLKLTPHVNTNLNNTVQKLKNEIDYLLPNINTSILLDNSGFLKVLRKMANDPKLMTIENLESEEFKESLLLNFANTVFEVQCPNSIENKEKMCKDIDAKIKKNAFNGNNVSVPILTDYIEKTKKTDGKDLNSLNGLNGRLISALNAKKDKVIDYNKFLLIRAKSRHCFYNNLLDEKSSEYLFIKNRIKNNSMKLKSRIKEKNKSERSGFINAISRLKDTKSDIKDTTLSAIINYSKNSNDLEDTDSREPARFIANGNSTIVANGQKEVKTAVSDNSIIKDSEPILKTAVTSNLGDKNNSGVIPNTFRGVNNLPLPNYSQDFGVETDTVRATQIADANRKKELDSLLKKQTEIQSKYPISSPSSAFNSQDSATLEELRAKIASLQDEINKSNEVGTSSQKLLTKLKGTASTDANNINTPTRSPAATSNFVNGNQFKDNSFMPGLAGKSGMNDNSLPASRLGDSNLNAATASGGSGNLAIPRSNMGAKSDSVAKIYGIVLTKSGELTDDLSKVAENPKEAELLALIEKSNGNPFIIKENGEYLTVTTLKLDGKIVYENGMPKLVKQKLDKGKVLAAANRNSLKSTTIGDLRYLDNAALNATRLEEMKKAQSNALKN